MIGIISDTHDNVESIIKAVEIFKKNNVDFVIHLGDVVAPATIPFFSGLKVHFVKGNNDTDLPKRLKRCEEIGATFAKVTLRLEHEGKKIAANHYPEAAEKLVKSQRYDYVFYGHDHVQRNEKIGKTRLINPGAHYYKTDMSIVILDLKNDKVEFINLS